MTWGGQLWHSLRTDLRHARWLLAAYIAVIAWLVVDRLQGGASDQITSWLPYALILLSGLIIITAVQAQSPSAEGASWRVLPLSPTAVLASKLALIVCLLLLGLTGQWLALTALQPDAAQLRAALAASVPPFAICGAITAVVASQTRSIQSFFLALVAIGLCFVLLLNLGIDPVRTNGSLSVGGRRFPVGFTVLAVAIASMAFAAATYVRPVRRRVLLGVCAACVVTVFGAEQIVAAQRSATPRSRVDTLPYLPDQYQLAATIHVLGATSADPAQVDVGIQFAVNRGDEIERILLDYGSILLTFPEGDTARVAIDGFLRRPGSAHLGAMEENVNLLQDPLVVPQSTIAWPPSDRDRASPLRRSTIVLRVDRAAHLRAGRATAHVDGYVSVLSGVNAAELPFERDAANTMRGRKIALLDSVRAPGITQPVMHVQSMRSVDALGEISGFRRASRAPSLLLLDSAARTATDVGAVVTHSVNSPPVIFGAKWHRMHLALQWKPQPSTSGLPDTPAAPLSFGAGTRLVVVEWNERARYQFRTPERRVSGLDSLPRVPR